MSRANILRILRQQLKWNACRPHTEQVLFEANIAKWLAACHWFIHQPIDFFEKHVIFCDHNYFVLIQGPKMQTDRLWAPATRLTPISLQSARSSRVAKEGNVLEWTCGWERSGHGWRSVQEHA